MGYIGKFNSASSFVDLESPVSVNSKTVFSQNSQTDAITLSADEVNVGSNALVVDSSGNVGIGTTPGAKLDVNGLILISGNQRALQFEKNDGSVDNIFFYDNGNANNTLYVGRDSNIMTLRTAGQHRLTIDSSGNVGIGASSPTSRMSIGDSTVNSANLITFGKRVTSTQTNLPLIGHTSHDGAASDLGICATSSGGNIIFYTGNNYAGFGAGSNAERMRIDTSGHVIAPYGVTLGTAVGTYDTASTLDDYEEGTLDWKLQRSDQIAGSNYSDTKVTYTKIGNRVQISGYIYTRNTGSSTGVTARLLNASTNSSATLPFLPNHTGVLTIGHTRTLSPSDKQINIGFQKDDSTVYIYENNAVGDYVPNYNNLPISVSQTYLVITFQGVYSTDL